MSGGAINQPFVGLYSEMNQNQGEPSIDISLTEFNSGFTLYVFDTSLAHNASSGEYSKYQDGRAEVLLTFTKDTGHNIVVLAFLEYERMYTIDEFRNCMIDETPNNGGNSS